MLADEEENVDLKQGGRGCKGTVVYLSQSELEKLDVFEKCDSRDIVNSTNMYNRQKCRCAVSFRRPDTVELENTFETDPNNHRDEDKRNDLTNENDNEKEVDVVQAWVYLHSQAR